MTREGVCECGHPAGKHYLVPGFECGPDVTIDGQTSIPDVWVCGGGRFVPNPTEDMSPWEFVCGCVLYSDPRVSA